MNADAILATGRHGLEYFRLFGPPHATLTGADFDFDRDFARRYDGAGEIGFAALRADGERFESVGETLTDITLNLRNRGNGVFAAWEGASADTANEQFTALLSAAADLRDQFTGLGAAVTDVVETADRGCHDKAEAVAKLHATRVAGRDAEEIGFLVDVAPRLTADDVTDEELAHAARLVEVPFAGPATQARVASAVDHWLTNTFVPDYERHATRFDAVCATAEENLATAWRGLATALASVRADQFDAVVAPLPSTVAQPMAAAPAAPAAAAPVTAASTAAPAEPVPTAEPAPTAPDPLSAGQSVGADTMVPSAFRAAPAPAAPALPATATGQDGTQNFFGGLPFGGAPAGGGGEVRQSLDLPVAPGAFDDLAAPPAATVALGAADDTTRYTDELPEAEELPVEPRKSIAERLDDEVW